MQQIILQQGLLFSIHALSHTSILVESLFIPDKPLLAQCLTYTTSFPLEK